MEWCWTDPHSLRDLWGTLGKVRYDYALNGAPASPQARCLKNVALPPFVGSPLFRARYTVLANTRFLGYCCRIAIKKLPGGKYEHDYRADGKRRYKRFRTKAEALAHELEINTAKAGGTLVDTRTGGRIRFHDLYKEWILRIERVGARGTRPASPVTVAGYRSIYESHMRPNVKIGCPRGVTRCG